jgi:enoyl-CoA hydratase
MPGWGLTVLLPQAIGVRRAREMSLTGNFMAADEALRVGLVNHVVAHEELLPAARKLASDIAGNDQAAVRNLKKLYDANEKVSVGDAIDQEQAYFRAWTIDPAEIERRRAGVVARGRGQQ